MLDVHKDKAREEARRCLGTKVLLQLCCPGAAYPEDLVIRFVEMVMSGALRDSPTAQLSKLG